VLPESLTARRNLSLLNPGITHKPGTTNNILMGMQMVKPGEVAWAHRHSIAAMRFAIEGGQDLYSVVDGERLPMEPNDLVLTPLWTWHDHHNDSTTAGIWLDVLDVPLIVGLGQVGFEKYGASSQVQRPNAHDYVSARVGNVRPAWEQRPLRGYPLRYAWKDVGAELARLETCAGSPHDGVILEYVNPMTGGSALPTMRCCIQALRPGFEGQAHKHTASTVCYVVEGEGSTVVDSQELRWGPRDVFAVPNACTHRHVNRSVGKRAVLFSVSDAPLLEAIGLYREDPPSNAAALPPVPARPARA
jgi:gentisate 1,2-dioxygenase